MRTPGPDDPAGLSARGWQRWWSRWADRRRGGPAPRHVRRVLAALLVVIGGVLAVLPARAAGGVAVAVTTDDLPIGTVLDEARIRTESVAVTPDGALTPQQVAGRVLAAPVRRGEILTDARLVAADGPDPGTGRVAVPVNLPDPGVVALLRPGLHVAVLAVGDGATGAETAPGTAAVTVLAEDAVVLTVLATRESGTARLGSGAGTVLLAVPDAAADDIAAHAVLGSLTLRFT